MKEKLSIFMVGSYPLPVGGVATHCYYLTQELQKQGIEVTFLDTFRRQKKRIPPGVRYSMIEYKFWKVNPFFFLTHGSDLLAKSILYTIKFLPCFTYKELIKFFAVIVNLFILLGHNRPKIIHSHHAYPRSLAAIIIGKHYKIPIVLTIHASELVNKKLIKLAKYVIQNVDKVISVSAHTRKLVQKHGISKEIQVIPNGVKTTEFKIDPTPVRNKYSLAGEKIILFVGGFAKRKGPQILLKSIPFIKSKNVKVVFVGPDLGFQQVIQRMIADEGIEKKALVVGEIPEKELYQFYKIGVLFVLPSITENEGFGIVLLEAMANGIPVVGSKIGGIPEVIIDGETGFLFEPSNHLDLAKKINKLINNELLCRKMGQRGRDLVESKFSWTKIVSQIKRIYLAYG